MKNQIPIKSLVTLQVILYTISCTESAARSDTILTAQYSISKNGKTIGALTAQSRSYDKGRNITLKSRAKTRMVFEIQIDQSTENIIGDHFLNETSSERKINGSVTLKHGLKYEQGVYRNIGPERAKGPLPEKITSTVTMLYFAEPLGISIVYAELQKRMVPLESISLHTYRLKMGETEYSDFYYQNGELKKVIARSYVGTMVISRESETKNGITKK